MQGLHDGHDLNPSQVNYTLSVLPFLAAADAGLLEPRQLQPPPSELDGARRSWAKFWEDLKETSRRQDGAALSEFELDGVQRKLWHCHTESIQAAQKVYEAQLLKPGCC